MNKASLGCECNILLCVSVVVSSFDMVCGPGLEPLISELQQDLSPRATSRVSVSQRVEEGDCGCRCLR